MKFLSTKDQAKSMIHNNSQQHPQNLPCQLQLSQLNESRFIDNYEISFINIHEIVQELEKEAGEKIKKLYGVTLILNGQRPSMLKMAYLVGCFHIFGWEKISVHLLEQYIDKLEDSAGSVENIRMDQHKLKFDKNQKSLVYDLVNGGMLIQSKSWEPLRGRGAYTISFTRLNFSLLQSYQVDELILQVEESGSYLAIRTRNFVYVFADKGSGQFKRYSVQTVDVKWCGPKLYLFCRNGSIRFIHRSSAVCSIKGPGLGLDSEDLGSWETKELMIDIDGKLAIAKVAGDKVRVRTLNNYYCEFRWEIPSEESVIFIGGFYREKNIYLAVVTSNSQGAISSYHEIRLAINYWNSPLC